MIRPFQLQDLGAFLPNEYSNPDVVFPALVSPSFEVQSMVAPDDAVQAIVAYKNYWGNCWQGFLLIAERFPFPAARALRAHLHGTMALKNALRFQTDSVSCDCLRKWHEYLGFTLEGTRKKMMFNRDYDMWALLREGE